MFNLAVTGSTRRLRKILLNMADGDLRSVFEKYGAVGVEALSQATPKDTGTTAASWDYEVVKMGRGYALQWHNTNINDGVNIAVIIQVGHGTGTGGYVRGVDYINPAMEDVFERIKNDILKEVKNYG